MKEGGNVVTLSKTNNHNNFTNLALATVFAANSKNKKLGDKGGGKGMFTGWELARIVAKTDKDFGMNGNIATNAANVLNCLQDKYRKLDIVFYEFANCKVNSGGDYDFSNNGGPDPTKAGKFSIEVCFALAKQCLRADKNDPNAANNLIDGLDIDKIFTAGENEGKYDDNYCKTDRYEG